MPDLKIKTRIVIRNADKESFENSDIVLLKGELAIELDNNGNGKFKVGNGTNNYSELPYITLTPTEVNTALNNFIKDININGRHLTYTKGNDTVNEYNVDYKNAELGQGYGECNSENTTNLIITINDFILKIGGIVTVKFTKNVPAEATLNISNTGAKNIYCFGSRITNGFINAGDIVTFIYDGVGYHVISSVTSSNNNIVIGGNKPDFPCTWIQTD